MKILVINPGSTSTKIAVYENETPLLVRNIKHTVEELSVYPQVIDQFEFRKNLVLQELEANGIPFAFDAVIGRGGLVKPIPGGVYWPLPFLIARLSSQTREWWMNWKM